jgi:hypothetical protein
VLDAKKIERLDDDTFRCYVGGLHFFNFVVEPVLTLSVVVKERGPVVKLLDTKLQGSRAVEAANNRFSATMTNIVTWEETDDMQTRNLCSDTTIRVSIQVPAWAAFIPVSAAEKTGNSVMQRVLNTSVPKFLKQLEKDYHLWSSGDDSRKPMGTGEL